MEIQGCQKKKVSSLTAGINTQDQLLLRGAVSYRMLLLVPHHTEILFMKDTAIVIPEAHRGDGHHPFQDLLHPPTLQRQAQYLTPDAHRRLHILRKPLLHLLASEVGPRQASLPHPIVISALEIPPLLI